MQDFIENWLLDPTVGRIVSSVVAILILISLIRFFQKTISKKIKDTDTRYRVRKKGGVHNDPAFLKIIVSMKSRF